MAFEVYKDYLDFMFSRLRPKKEEIELPIDHNRYEEHFIWFLAKHGKKPEIAKPSDYSNTEDIKRLFDNLADFLKNTNYNNPYKKCSCGAFIPLIYSKCPNCLKIV